jgi:hypothetical protein
MNRLAGHSRPNGTFAALSPHALDPDLRLIAL